MPDFMKSLLSSAKSYMNEAWSQVASWAKDAWGRVRTYAEDKVISAVKSYIDSIFGKKETAH